MLWVLPPLGVDTSNLSMGRTPLQVLTKFTTPLMGQNLHLEATLNPTPLLAFPPIGGLTPLLGSPLGGSDRHHVGLTLVQIRSIQSVVGSHPHFKTPFQICR